MKKFRNSLLIMLTIFQVACTFDVHEGGGQQVRIIPPYQDPGFRTPHYVEPPRRNYSARLPMYGDAQYVEPPNGGFRYENRNPYQPRGEGRTIYHGDQARHVYGSGPQSYARIPDPRDPNPYRPR